MLLNQNQIQELIGIAEAYNGQDILITNWIENEDDSYRSQVLEGVDVYITENSLCFFDVNEDKIEFPFDRLENIYIDNVDIFTDECKEIHIMFDFMGMRYSILNLV